MHAIGTQRLSQVSQPSLGLDGGFPLYPAYNQLLTRNPETLKYANEGYSRNSIVFNVFTRRAEAIHQAKVVVKKKMNPKTDKSEAVPDCQLQQLLNNPNEYMGTSEYWQQQSLYIDVGGTSFNYKVRDNYGVIEQIYPYHASQMNYIQGTTRWVDGYVYDNGAGYRQVIPKEDVGVFKFPNVNFFYPYKGFSPLLALLKEVNVDNQRGELETALLLNGGVPSFAIYPGEKSPTPMSQDQIDFVMEGIMTKINGKNRGRPLLMNKDYKIEKIGYSPKDMMLTDFSLIPETRICAVYGVPVGYAQMLTGLEYAGTYANRAEDKQTFYETMVNCWVQYANSLERMFKDETFYDGKGSDYTIEFDYSKLPALMESSNNIQSRVLDQWKANVIPLNKVLEHLGEELLDDTDPRANQYYTEATGMSVGVVDPDTQATGEPAPVVPAKAEPKPKV